MRILDPELKILRLTVPRVSGTEYIQLRFSALFGDTVRAKDVRIEITDDVEVPKFKLHESAVWTPGEKLILAPTVTNLAKIKTSRFPVIHFAGAVDTA